jgi:hypothetical protein
MQIDVLLLNLYFVDCFVVFLINVNLRIYHYKYREFFKVKTDLIIALGFLYLV